MRKGVVRGEERGLRGGLAVKWIVDVVLRERLELKSLADQVVELEVPELLRLGRGVERKDGVLVLPHEVLLEGQIRTEVRRVVPHVDRRERVVAAGDVDRRIEVGAGKRVLCEILIRREVDDVGAERDGDAAEIRDRAAEMDVGTLADRRGRCGETRITR